MHKYLILTILWLLAFPYTVFATEQSYLASPLNFSANTEQHPDQSGADPLPVDEAYRFSAVVEATDRLRLNWIIASGTYLYKDSIHLTLENAKGVELDPVMLPPGIMKQNAVRPDGNIGTIEIYHDKIDFLVSLRRSNTAATQITLVTKYQGCAQQGFCYPPVTKIIHLDLPAIVTTPTATITPTKIPILAPFMQTPTPLPNMTSLPLPPMAEQDRLAAKLHQGSIWGIVITFFGLGLLLAFTPCIFPMIPILSGIIVGQGQNITPWRGFVLSLVYVLAMASTYTAAGIMAGLFGQNLQAIFQNPWILASFALLFIILALAMFGLYELQLPTGLQTRISILSNRQRGGNLLGVAIMGMLSALIVGPCVAPPLAGALIYIGQTGDAWLGGIALFALGMGMGMPLLAIGLSAGRLLPRAGAWMDTVKAMFGVLMIGVAIVLLDRILPAFMIMLLWGTLLICTAVYMGALRHQPHGTPHGWTTLWQGLGLVMLIYGILMLVGAGSGGHDTLQPLQGLLLDTTTKTRAQTIAFQPIKTRAELDLALTKAVAEGRPVFLHFYADWCTSCKELERDTFTDADVQRTLANFVRLRVDVTANDADDQTLLQGQFGLPGPPALIFYDSKGQEQRHLRMVGFITAEQFIAQAEQVAKK